MAAKIQDQNLKQAIRQSVVLDAQQKKALNALLPQLKPDQKKTVQDFLAKEKAEFKAIEERYKKEKAPLYQQYAEQLGSAFQKARKMILREAEQKADAKKNADDILKEL